MVKGYDWVGNFYPKKQYEVSVARTDDSEEIINGIVLPPLMIPQRYWFSWSMVATEAADPHDHSWSVMSGRYFNLPLNLNTDDDSVMNGTTLMNTYAPSSIGEWGDDAPSATESDLPGHSAMDDQASKSEFLHRERFHRLGDGQSVIANANEVRYCWYGKASGKVVNKDNYCDILDPKMVAIGARSDQNEDSNDWSDVLMGDAADFNILQDAMFAVLDQDNPLTLGHQGTTTSLENWLKLGYSDTETSVERNLAWTSKLTLECALYKPKSTRYYSAG